MLSIPNTTFAGKHSVVHGEYVFRNLVDDKKYIVRQCFDNEVKSELNLLKTIRHKNIVPFLCATLGSNSQTIFVFDYFPSLGDYIQGNLKDTLPATEIHHILKDIVNGVDYLHSNHIAHTNLNPLNIKMAKRGNGKTRWKIFNSSTIIKTEEAIIELSSRNQHVLSAALKAPNFPNFPPEIGRDKFDHFKWDIWSLGCLVYYLVTKQYPKNAQNFSLFGECLAKKEELYFFMHLYSLCINEQPEKRPSAFEVQKALHMWHIDIKIIPDPYWFEYHDYGSDIKKMVFEGSSECLWKKLADYLIEKLDADPEDLEILKPFLSYDHHVDRDTLKPLFVWFSPLTKETNKPGEQYWTFKDIASLYKTPWFVGDLGHEETKQNVLHLPEKSFLIRFDYCAPHFKVYIHTIGKEVKRYFVKRIFGKVVKSELTGQKYPSLFDLVKNELS